MQLTWLKAFHVVASQGGFTAASRVLNVSQPTVSSQVKALEQYCGVELFFRRGHAVELAPLGKSLHEITSGLFGHEQEAIALLRAARTLGRGELRIAAVGPHDVMLLAARMKQQYPDLRLSVSLGHAPEVLKQLIEFKVDIAVLAQRPNDPAFHVAPFARHRVLVIVNPEHPLARRRGRTISIRDLAGERTIMREPLSTTRQAFERACEASGVATEVAMEINSREAVIEAVTSGLGLSVFAESELQPHPRLIALLIADAEMYVESYVACLSERRDRPLIKLFLDLAAKLKLTGDAPKASSNGKTASKRIMMRPPGQAPRHDAVGSPRRSRQSAR